ncbi:DUF3800 domain-containing protein [Xanthomarina sp.]|uniref:DUF3800 domain-containing protein n=1 Tax=Xanthomarina sp. TaxID=1931211 RepID=UPI002B541BB7|nr:hypothetical protein [Xanthomarina sp.]HLV40455.1 hypothetical protein [Xanthomarina sp.]
MKNTTHILAIDETGSFEMAKDDKSFVCATYIESSKDELINSYKEAYYEMHKNTSTIIYKEIDYIKNNDFHFSGLDDSKVRICEKHLLKHVSKVYKSKGQPLLFANNQSWWLTAVAHVISNFLKEEFIKKGESVSIYIDNRNEKVLGLLADTKLSKTEFEDYHNILIAQIKKLLSYYVKLKDIKLEIIFLSDTSCFFINLADIVCGFVRKHPDYLENEKDIKVKEFHCSQFMSGKDPSGYIATNPQVALSLIFQELMNDSFKNDSYLKQILAKLFKAEEGKQFAIQYFYNLLKLKIQERKNLIKLKPLVDMYKELISFDSSNINSILLILEYYTHIGAIKSPYSNDLILNLLKDQENTLETRFLRKWEHYISYSLKEAQILFNAYTFENVIEHFENIYDKQNALLEVLEEFNPGKKDEPSVAILGTLAQAYAYGGECDKAIEHFALSKDYIIKSSSRTASYLFTIYHRQKNIPKAREQFLKITKLEPESYFENNNFNNIWEILAYCKLRALELYCNATSLLKPIDLEALNLEKSEYPFPLIEKWEAIALWLEDKTANQKTIEKLFDHAISNLLKSENKFTIKSLALPLIQCYALVNNQNRFHSTYNTWLRTLKEESNSFEKYVDNKAPLLNRIKNDEDIWTRATLLPFIYS